MKAYTVLFFLLLTGISCTTKSKESDSPSVDVIKFSELTKIIQNDTGKTKVINFWATWCKPCVKELPHFEKLLADYGEENIEMVLVSFDFVEELDSKVIPFVKKKNLKSKVVLLDETDYNSFINRIDISWSGAIPATLMLDYRNDNRAFYENEFKEGELEKSYLEFVKRTNP